MADNTTNFLTNFMASWQVARIYETSHPKFVESLEKAYKSLEALWELQNEVVIGVVGEELTSGKEIFFELSKKMQLAIRHLKSIGVERIIFNKGVTKDEIVKLISFIITSNENLELDPQNYLLNLGVKNIEVGKIKDFGQGHYVAAVKGINKIEHYEDCLDKLSDSIISLIDDNTIDGHNFKFISNNIMENLIGSYQEFFKLKEIKSHDMATFIHILNVSILSIYFASKLGFSREDCLSVGLAGLFHDIGKLYIGRRIIQKTGKLDEREFGKIKSHTVLGAEILLKHVDKLTILPVVVAFEHHLNYDLGGYPKVYFVRNLHIASLIVSICDVYDALMQRRSYKNDYPPEMIYNIMMGGKGTKFSAQLLSKFFRIMGIWPRGTIVCLEDERIAIVREVNEEAIFSPRVEIISERSRRIIDLNNKKNIKIKRALNPLKEGKKYLELI